MSWYRGNQPITTELSSWRNARWISASLWRRLPWLTATPLGVLVEPEVYCRKARLSPPRCGGLQSPARLSGLSSIAIQAAGSSPTSAIMAGSRRANTAAVVNATRGAASSTMDFRRP